MTEVQMQTSKPLDQEGRDLAGQRFEQLAEAFTEGLRGVSPEAAEQAQEALEAIKDRFTSAVATEIEELRTAGDETSLRTALEKVTQLRESLSGAQADTQTEVSAETILQGFKKLGNGVIQLTLPLGTTIQEAGKLLNAAASEAGMRYPLFFEGDAEFWAKNEANPDLRTEPGQTYRFKIPTDSVLKTRVEQVRDHAPGAPLGVIAIAEACERLNTKNNTTLFKDPDGYPLWVRGSAPTGALYSSADIGVFVGGPNVDQRDNRVAFASSVPAENDPPA